ncbi:hypothetical protein MNEG_11697 [Monoraphidium neglectum]|uniref:ATP-dependent RNA helicase Ski2/MTR4 C-terminal domain-containing protein n=1 Tax=Monoraphidium neglectum TaxID=145388 RepID=A0A0D2J952_9CHLO|nr:hypothetical protein MNEG_11697 [Monoraphidium neglectum]KIY96267.1 hypothetical protein MNEG_11697 [Monoraphidium neglectum]|eukprot:XP_013895287.1 hypothetical protein MNEG_11697 [Monoraphidium neglectum]
MALALSHPAVLSLSAPQLAAYIAALVCCEVIRRPMSVWTPYQVSPEVLTAIEELEPAREALFEAQTAAGMIRWNESLLVDLRFAGIVEAWASGASWADVMGGVDLDDGDMARLLARTVDVLRQAIFLEHLLPYIVPPAREAVRAMDRPPISDLTL